MVYDLVVIGGGAAGFFGALQVAEMKGDLKILIVEKSPRLLSKVRISGGGRCNVTHSCFEAKKLSDHYPRGGKALRQIFRTYQASHVVNWFQTKGVMLKTENDGRMFPETDDSQTIIDCFLREAHRHGIRIQTGNGVERIVPDSGGFSLIMINGEKVFGKKVLLAPGGIPGIKGYDWISSLGIQIVRPVPSLFTFNDSARKFKDLMGISVPEGEVRIDGTKFSSRGPVLITHWGLSGPAVIRLSAWAAIYLNETGYDFTVRVNWTGSFKEEEIRNSLLEIKQHKGRQKIWTNPLFNLPQRLWWKLCTLAEIPEEKVWAELPLRNLNKLIEFLIRCPFQIKGKTTFKDEFVTCGGVDLSEINPVTMESRKVPGLYLAGEVLNIDGETGGFNFQAAWSTAYLAARGIVSEYQR